MSSSPPRMPAASLERKGFQTRYSVLVVVSAVSPLVVVVGVAVAGVSMEMRFSP